MHIKEWPTLYKVFNVSFFCHNPAPSGVMRLINGLLHSRCPDVHANEKIIILKLALSE